MSEKMFDLLITNGTIVTPDSQYQGFIAVKDRKIVEMGTDPTGLTADRVIDATGKHILPGGIDDHVHFRDPGDDLTYKEDATTGSIPYLRNVPVLRWLVAQDKDDFEDKKIITVISVRKMDGSPAQMDPLSNQLMKLKQADDAFYAQKDAKNPVEEPKSWWKFWKK